MIPLPEPDIGNECQCYEETGKFWYSEELLRAYGDAREAAERQRCLNEIECGIWVDKTVPEILDALAAAISTPPKAPTP